jgi:hypothetical protein
MTISNTQDHPLEAIARGHQGLARKALDYTLTMKALVDAAKCPGFSPEAWEPLAALVDINRFERVGNFKEVMDWREYVAFLSRWAPSAEWDCTFHRVTEGENLAILELEERTTAGPASSAVNSVSIYEFDAAGRIVHIDIYLQMALPDPAMLTSYEGIAITS